MSAIPTPVDSERVRSILADKRLCYTNGINDSWIAPTKNSLFTLSLENNDVLQISARWRGIATIPEEFLIMKKLVTQCNSTKTCPKVYLLSSTQGTKYTLVAECNILTHGGLTEEQFYGFSETSLTAILSFFADAEMALPQLVTWNHE